MGRSLLVGLVFFSIFIAGIVTGGSLMLHWARHHPGLVPRDNPMRGVAVPLGPLVMRQMVGQLDLTRDQRKSAYRILAEYADIVHVLRRETDFAIGRMQDDIDKLLTPGQRSQLGKLEDEQRARVQEQREKVRRYLDVIRAGDSAPALPQNPSPAAPETVPMQTVPAAGH
jgi:Spy/CpxP family protein refolding chaperone